MPPPHPLRVPPPKPVPVAAKTAAPRLPAGPPAAAGLKLSLAKSGKLAQVFNADESSDEEEIPPEARYGSLHFFINYYPSTPLPPPG